MNSPPFEVRPLAGVDRRWASLLLAERWGSPQIVTRGQIHRADLLPGFAAWLGKRPVGFLTYCISGPECEIISLDSLEEGRGIGAALLRSMEEEARARGVRRLWLITTNDNRQAVDFYERRGYRIAAVHFGAMSRSRKLKPAIPKFGMDGIPITDEIEMEKLLGVDHG